MKNKAFISFVLQMESLDEAQSELLVKLDEFLTSKFENTQLVIVDNCGHEHSYDQILSISDKLKGVTSVLKLSRKQPVEIALLAGVDKSIGDYIFQMDTVCADFELSLLEDLFKICSKGKDIVYASPRSKQSASTKLFYFLFNRFSSLATSLEHDRLILTSRRALNAALNTKQRFRYQKVLLSLTGFSREVVKYDPVVPVAFVKKPFLQRLDLALDLFVAYSAIGVKLGFTLCAGFVVFSMGICAFAIASYFLRQDINSGWTSLMLFLSVSFSGLFFLLSILSEYLRHILLEVQGSSLYLIEAYHTTPNKVSAWASDGVVDIKQKVLA
jgi:polyisoprenyl-phosphate glycosyltransferase